jgi:predicted secreted protein
MEFGEAQLSIYEKFEQLIVSILTWIIAVIVAVATWQLILHTVGMIRSPTCSIQRDSQAFPC